MTVALGVVAALVVIFLLIVRLGDPVLREYERGVIFRLGRLIAQKGPGLILLIPVIDRMVRVDLRTVTLNVPPQEVITRDNVPVARQRGRLLPRDRPEQGDHRGRELPARHLPDRADDAALGARQGRARRSSSPSASGSTRSCRRSSTSRPSRGAIKVSTVEIKDVEMPRGHAAGDGAPGRGRARAARQDHRRRGRVPGGPEARRRRRHHQPEPGDAAAALPADAARDRRQPELDDRLPAADRADERVHEVDGRRPGGRQRRPPGQAAARPDPGGARRPGRGDARTSRPRRCRT